MIIPNDFSLTISKSKTYEDNSLNNQSYSFLKRNVTNNKKINNYIINFRKNKLNRNSQSMINLQHHGVKEKMQKSKIKNIQINLKKKLSLIELEKKVYKNFKNMYVDDNYYNIQKIDEIINNEKSHLVAEFKDFLVKGDTAEFLLESYNYEEINLLYPQILEYYNENLFIFPNYVTLPESKYIYINIQKKQKIIDIQEEIQDNENSKAEENNKTVFTGNEIESLLNQTDTSGIKQYFGISETNTENNNGIDKNEQQILKLIDNINDIEKKNITNHHYKSNTVYLKNNNISKFMKIDNNNNNDKIFYKVNQYKFKGINRNNNNYKERSKNNSKAYNSEIKNEEKKLSNKRNNLSQPNLKSQNTNNKSLNNVKINSINNNFKEKSKKIKNKIIRKDTNESIKLINKKRIMENIYNKNNDNQFYKKIFNKYDSLLNENIPININYNINVITKLDNKIRINKNILNEINNYHNKEKDRIISSMKSKSYKKVLMNVLLNSRNGSINDINNNIKSNFSKKIIKHKIKNNSGNEVVLEKFLTSTINGKEKSITMNKKKIFLKSEKNNLKLGKIENQKREISNKNQLSSSCKNMSINSYITKKFKNEGNNKNIIKYYTNRNNNNSSYKLITNISNAKNLINKEYKTHFKRLDNYLTCEENRKSANINKNINKRGSKTLLDSYSTKEMTNKNRKSKDSYKNIIDSKILREIKSQNQNQNPYQNNLNKSKRLFQNKDTKKLNKSPNKNREFPLTDRKTKDQIEINLEKIEILSKEIKKIKENLKKSAAGNNSISLSCILGKNKSKSKSTKRIEKKESKKFINYNNNNVIRVYLSNKTRNRSKKKKNNLNSDNLVTNKSNNQRMYNLAYTYRKDNELKSNDFQTLNSKNNNINNMSQKNSMDNFYKIKYNTIMDFNKKEKNKEYK